MSEKFILYSNNNKFLSQNSPNLHNFSSVTGLLLYRLNGIQFTIVNMITHLDIISFCKSLKYQFGYPNISNNFNIGNTNFARTGMAKCYNNSISKCKMRKKINVVQINQIMFLTCSNKSIFLFKNPQIFTFLSFFFMYGE